MSLVESQDNLLSSVTEMGSVPIPRPNKDRREKGKDKKTWNNMFLLIIRYIVKAGQLIPFVLALSVLSFAYINFIVTVL
eukprot:Ihof_evm2s167 gene=Ihof_evmTU2s167